MDKRGDHTLPKKYNSHCCYDEEVSSIEWECINMTEQEEDLICRMHKLVGDRWELIAGRVPGRKAEEIERFWLMKNWRAHSRKPEKSSKAKKS